MVDQDEYLQAVYGPLATRAEHRRGDTIRYRKDGEVHSGVLLWICAQQADRDPPLRLCYVVESEDGSAPRFVFPSDVLSS